MNSGLWPETEMVKGQTGGISTINTHRLVTSSKSSSGRVEGEKQRRRLKELYGQNLNNYPIMYHGGWPLDSPNIQKYFFGLTKRKFIENIKSDGYFIFICGKAEQTLFIPAGWVRINYSIVGDIPDALKFNIPVEEDDFYWMKKTDGITINKFLNNLPS
jgi:hypothetical protein